MKRLSLLFFLFSMYLYDSELSFASDSSMTLTLAAVEWKPMNSPELENDGYMSEIVRSALSQMGYTLDIKWAPWNRVLEMSKLGGYDGILVASHKKEREDYFEYSHKIGSERFIFWQRSEDDYSYDSLNSFNGMKVGVLLGSNFTQDLKNHGNIIVDEVSNIRQNILKLSHGRIDAFLGSYDNVNYILNSELSEHRVKLKPITPDYRTYDLYMLISKKHPNHKSIVKGFNHSLKKMIMDGRYESILVEHDILNVKIR